MGLYTTALKGNAVKGGSKPHRWQPHVKPLPKTCWGRRGAKYAAGKASGFGLKSEYGKDDRVYDNLDNVRKLVTRSRAGVR